MTAKLKDPSMKKRKYFKLPISFLLLFLTPSCSQIKVIPKEEKKEIVKKEIITPKETPKVYRTKTKENTSVVKAYCDKIQATFDKYSWGDSKCDTYSWNHVRSSKEGNPIIWFVYGSEKAHKKENQNATVILCGVHGDEITPIKFCFDIMEDIKENPALVKDSLVVIAPIVTPDSFFTKKPSRTNASGVDVNRNFPTKDWKRDALSIWKNRYRKDPRRFPGNYAMSEQETLFQVNLIKRYSPNKVISVHAPLTILDYDGPGKNRVEGKKARELLIQMSEKAQKYKVSDFPFFPGSLGNWAGNERDIPTYTLELPNSDWTKTNRYFKQFQPAIRHAIESDIRVTEESKVVLNTKEEK